MSWTFSFESSPSPSSRGLVTGSIIRETKSVFKELFSKEHTFDDGTNPIITHKPGQCSVVGFTVTPNTEARGSLVFDFESGALGADFGLGTIEPAGAVMHSSLANLESDSAHAQYVLKADFSRGEIDLDPGGNTDPGDYCPTQYSDIINLETGLSPNSIENEHIVLSQQDHFTKPPSGEDVGAHHKDRVITRQENKLTEAPHDIHKPSINFSFQLKSVNNGAYIREMNYCSIPVPGIDVDVRTIIRASNNDHDDYYPSFVLSDSDRDPDTGPLFYWLSEG